MENIENKTNIFIEKSKEIHGDRYDYSKVKYVNAHTKVCIICKNHGEFFITPNKHLLGQGCAKCVGRNKSNEEFIKECIEVHGNRYDYSKVEYINVNTKVCIICPIHGEFWQLPNAHLKGQGCNKCKGGVRYTKEEFINKANNIHNHKYDYHKVEYVNNKTSVIITCPIHGDFEQRPYDHLNGCGCPKCNSSHLENNVRNILNEFKIEFIEQKKFDWLGKQSLDFYIPIYNIGIECQGIQHFKPIKHFGGEYRFKNQVDNDNKKMLLCEENNIKLLYINYNFDEKTIKSIFFSFFNK